MGKGPWCQAYNLSCPPRTHMVAGEKLPEAVLWPLLFHCGMSPPTKIHNKNVKKKNRKTLTLLHVYVFVLNCIMYYLCVCECAHVHATVCSTEARGWCSGVVSPPLCLGDRITVSARCILQAILLSLPPSYTGMPGLRKNTTASSFLFLTWV